jgi:hypothetical protein
MIKKKAQPNIKSRDFNKLLSIKGEIDLRTKSERTDNMKYNRKNKHKNVGR